MKKQINWEQISEELVSITLKNIFGLSLSHIHDKIKRLQGKWDPKNRKYQLPISNINPFLKHVNNDIDRTILIEKPLSHQPVSQMLKKYASKHLTKIKKQIYIDETSYVRYPFINHQIISKIVENASYHSDKKFNGKILIVSSKLSTLNWVVELNSGQSKSKQWVKGVIEDRHFRGASVLATNEGGIWLIGYDQFITHLKEISILKKEAQFSTLILDEAQILSHILKNEQNDTLKKYIYERNLVFIILQRFNIIRIGQLLSLIELVMSGKNEKSQIDWMEKRYRSEHYREMQYVLEACGIYKYLEENLLPKPVHSKIMKAENSYLVQYQVAISENGLEKIKSITRKQSSSIPHYKQLLSQLHTYKTKTKPQKTFVESIQNLLHAEKQQAIKTRINFFVNTLHTKITILIHSVQRYRQIQNYLCENQISYCHYQHPRDVIDFNTNVSMSVCLIKSDRLISFFQSENSHKDDLLEYENRKIKEQYMQQQYRCISSVNNILIPDMDWLKHFNSPKIQHALNQCFMYVHSSLIRHYFIIKGSYQEMWLKAYFQTIKKIEEKQKSLLPEEFLETQSIDTEDNKLMRFSEVQQSEVLEEYDHCPFQEGVCDIDDEFDRFQFEAMKQKEERERKNKERKEREKGKIKKQENKSKQKGRVQKNQKKAKDFQNKAEVKISNNIKGDIIKEQSNTEESSLAKIKGQKQKQGNKLERESAELLEQFDPIEGALPRKRVKKHQESFIKLGKLMRQPSQFLKVVLKPSQQEVAF